MHDSKCLLINSLILVDDRLVEVCAVRTFGMSMVRTVNVKN